MDYLNPVKLYSTYQDKQNEKKAREADITARTSKIRIERELSTCQKDKNKILKDSYANMTNKRLTKAQLNEKNKKLAIELDKLERKEAAINQQLLFVTNNQSRAKDVDFENKFLKTTAPNSISTLTHRKMDVKALEKIEEDYEITEDSDEFVYSSARFLDNANRTTEYSQRSSFSHHNPEGEDDDQKESETNSMNNLMLKMMDAGYVTAPQSQPAHQSMRYQEDERNVYYSSSSRHKSNQIKEHGDMVTKQHINNATDQSQYRYSPDQQNNTNYGQPNYPYQANNNNNNINNNNNNKNQNLRNTTPVSPPPPSSSRDMPPNQPHSRGPVYQKTTEQQHSQLQQPYYFNLNDLPTAPNHIPLQSHDNLEYYSPPSRPSSPAENVSTSNKNKKGTEELSDPDFENMMARLEKLKNVRFDTEAN